MGACAGLPDSINQGGTARALLVLGFTKTRRALFYVLGMLSLGSVPAEVEERLQGMSVIDDIKSLHADTLSAIGKVPNTDALEKIRVEVVGKSVHLPATCALWARLPKSIVPKWARR